MMTQSKDSYIIFRVSGRLYAISINNILEVSESNDINPLPGAPCQIVGVKKFRDVIVPVIDVIKKFNIPTDNHTDTPSKYIVMLEIKTVNNNVKKFGILIDKVLSVTAINPSEIKTVDNLSDSLATAPYIKGIMSYLDNKFVYVLLPEMFFNSNELNKIEKIVEQSN